jgi:hypothetical protein
MQGRAEFLHRYKGWEKQDKEILVSSRQREGWGSAIRMPNIASENASGRK